MLTKKQIAFYLEDIETPSGRAVSWILTGLILLSSVIFVTETYPIPDTLRLELQALDAAILIIFGIEYLVRFWCAENKLKFVFQVSSIIDLLAILPFFLGVVMSVLSEFFAGSEFCDSFDFSNSRLRFLR